MGIGQLFEDLSKMYLDNSWTTFWEIVGQMLEMLFTMAGQLLDDLVIDGRATAVETETMLGPNAWAK